MILFWLTLLPFDSFDSSHGPMPSGRGDQIQVAQGFACPRGCTCERYASGQRALEDVEDSLKLGHRWQTSYTEADFCFVGRHSRK